MSKEIDQEYEDYQQARRVKNWHKWYIGLVECMTDEQE